MCQARFVKQDFLFTHFTNKYYTYTILLDVFNQNKVQCDLGFY